MREVRLRVGADDLEDVLDELLPALPGGAHTRLLGAEVELAMASVPGSPDEDELRHLAGPRLIDLSSAEVSDDWRARRLARYEPLVIAERFLVRPDWAPGGAAPGQIEIELGQRSAFGTGLHPTTQACLATLVELDPGGSLADLGCGSGVLSIAASRLGFSPVSAIDVDEGSVAAAGDNASRNGVEISARRADLTAEPAPPAATVVANVPPEIHLAICDRLQEAPRQAVVSGFKPDEAAAVAAAWGDHGLRVQDDVRAQEWVALVLR